MSDENVQLLLRPVGDPGFPAVVVMVGDLPEFLRVGEPQAHIFPLVVGQGEHPIVPAHDLQADPRIPVPFFHDFSHKNHTDPTAARPHGSGQTAGAPFFLPKKHIVLMKAAMAHPPLLHSPGVQISVGRLSQCLRRPGAFFIKFRITLQKAASKSVFSPAAPHIRASCSHFPVVPLQNAGNVLHKIRRLHPLRQCDAPAAPVQPGQAFHRFFSPGLPPAGCILFPHTRHAPRRDAPPDPSM